MNIRSTVLATDQQTRKAAGNPPAKASRLEVESSALPQAGPKESHSPYRDRFEIGAFVVGGLAGGGTGAVMGPIFGLNLAGVTTSMVRDNGFLEYLGPMLKGSAACAIVGAVGCGLALGLYLGAVASE